jgi:hypothetical protein
MKRFAIFAMLAALVPWAAAQRGGAAGAHGAFHGGTGSSHVERNRGTSFGRGTFGRSRFDRYGYGYGAPYDYLSLPFPFFDDAYDSGDMYSTGYPVAAPLPPYLPPQYGVPEPYGPDSFGPEMNSRSSPSPQPLMIELQNGRYVRVASTAIDGEATPLSANANNSSPAVSSQNSPEYRRNEATSLAPVVLIFKDGHSEQVRDYTIANGTLYAHGDFYTDGYWDKRIDLASLDLPQTVQANASRNVNFVLPSSPNEVIARF